MSIGVVSSNSCRAGNSAERAVGRRADPRDDASVAERRTNSMHIFTRARILQPPAARCRICRRVSVMKSISVCQRPRRSRTASPGSACRTIFSADADFFRPSATLSPAAVVGCRASPANRHRNRIAPAQPVDQPSRETSRRGFHIPITQVRDADRQWNSKFEIDDPLMSSAPVLPRLQGGGGVGGGGGVRGVGSSFDSAPPRDQPAGQAGRWPTPPRRTRLACGWR